MVLIDIVKLVISEGKHFSILIYRFCNGAATRVSFDEMRPSLQRWLRQGINVAHSKSLKDFAEYLTKNDLSYIAGVLKSEILNHDPENYCLAMYSPEICNFLLHSDEISFDVHADATFDIIPKTLFPSKTRKKQFLTIMLVYRTKVSFFFNHQYFNYFLF